MEISAERHGSAVVVSLGGSLTVDADTNPLRDLGRALRRVDASGLVLDLGNIRRLDSYGVGQLVTLYNEVHPKGMVVTLANVERHQKRLLEVAGLLAVFHFADSWMDAVTRSEYRLAPRSETSVEPSYEVTRHAA